LKYKLVCEYNEVVCCLIKIRAYGGRMKKKLASLIILSSIVFSTQANAMTLNSASNTNDIDGKQIAFLGEGVVQSLLEQAIYQVGNRVIDKVLGPDDNSYYDSYNNNYNDRYYNNSNYNNSQNSYDYNSSSPYTNYDNGDVPNEELIPIS